MAFAALVSLAKTIYLILNYHQTSIPTPFRNQIKSIHKNVSFLQAVLPDFPKTPSSLEHRIRDLAYKAEDVVEIVWSDKVRDSSKSKLKQPNQNHENLCYDFPDLEKVTKEVEAIVKEVRERHKEVVVGFDKELIEVKEKLLRDQSNLEFVPIVGMPGIGKTTLAKYTYEDALFEKHFDVRGWIRVSQHYNFDQIVSSLGASIGLSNAKIEMDDVFRKLVDRRYLIVLDDIWSVEAWDELQRMFPDNGNKSRIMFTTRLLDLATSIASDGIWIHHMQLLNEISSWELLRNRIFGDKPCPSELEPLGRMVAACCSGLPLAIVVISGLLAVDQKTVAVWEKVAQDVKSAISENDSQFDKILSLSYTHLPHHLRPLFLYLGGFPQDYEMPVSKLVKLWVAEGFLKQSGSNKSLEEIAEDYLEDLIKRNLVSAAKRKPNGRIKRFGLHDLMREMCIRKAQEHNFFLHVRGSLDQGTKILRRVSVAHSDMDFLYGSAIHTVICLCDRKQGKKCSFDNCRLLRILDLIDAQEYFYKSDSSSNSLPDHLFELFHLRYLALDYPFSIPAAISNLRNLQTLIIALDNHHLKPVELPVEIWRLPQLRHILIASCVFPSEQGATIALENLQTLFKAVNFVCSEEILVKIPNLKKLGILYKGDDEKTYEKDYELQNLATLQTLEDLKIEMCNFPKEKPRLGPDFPKKLKNLTLSGVGLPWEDFKIVSSLSNLQVLKLRDNACIGETWETTDGGFSQLEFLLIDQSHFENWITESSHFPRLKFLVLHHCWSLVGIPEDVGDFSALELIEVDDCNACLKESAKMMKSYLDDTYGDGMVLVRFVTG
ncbi:putative late blight resistance protein homolog R1A-10 [Salvia hispanica]|uniref:putative late blight resistance protein homolog R1A-10 n=1 Tax=Salvia hispanica TaxID=49212 RepID=UPI002009D6EA|nr:putative late blight resistance protein homolog R1A-10 [Salvia hispanica]